MIGDEAVGRRRGHRPTFARGMVLGGGIVIGHGTLTHGNRQDWAADRVEPPHERGGFRRGRRLRGGSGGAAASAGLGNKSPTRQRNPGTTSSPESSTSVHSQLTVLSPRKTSTARRTGRTTQISLTPARRYSLTFSSSSSIS